MRTKERNKDHLGFLLNKVTSQSCDTTFRYNDKVI